MRFRYKVITEDMTVAEGVLEAVDLEAAKRIAQDNRWQVISLQETPPLEQWLGKSIKGKVKYESIAAFCSQLAMMIRSGANLVRGLEILQAQLDDRRLKEVVRILYQGVRRGNTLAQAMRDCEGALPDLLINLVAVGEESGNLDSVLMSMAAYYDRENFIRKKITSAAIYPAILTVVLIGLVTLFMNFILPEITNLMTQNGQSLPILTQMIVDGTRFLQANGLFLFIGLSGLLLALRSLFKRPKYRFFLDAFILRVPLFGKNLKNVIISRFARTLALFLHSSIPIVPIFNSMENIIGNEVPRQALVRARERIIRGETLSGAFGQEKFFDPLIIQMMAIGEETGRLEELMEEVANHYEKRVELGIARMVALVEPAFTVLIGIFAGGLIISIALPIFSMANAVK